MRIISKQKDFYDYGSIYGIDHTVIYERKPIVFRDRNDPIVSVFNNIKNERFKFHTINYKNKINEGIDYGQFYVVIGGFFYNFYFFKENGVKKIFNKLEDFQEYTKNVLVKSNFSFYSNKSLLFYEDTGPSGSEIFQDIFSKYDYPVLVYGVEPLTKYNTLAEYNNFSNIESFNFANNVVCANVPFLNIIGLGSMLDANKCFNDISNFLISKKEPVMVAVSDSEKITKHGFDKKISFRGKQT